MLHKHCAKWLDPKETRVLQGWISAGPTPCNRLQGTAEQKRTNVMVYLRKMQVVELLRSLSTSFSSPSLFFFFNLSPHLTQVMYDKKFSRFFFFLFLKRWLCSAPTLTISGWVQSARVNILPCCTHHLAALPVGWMCGFKGIVGEGLCLFFLFCVFVRVVSAEKIRFVLKPAIFSILSTSICFIPVCVCVDYVMFFFFFLSLLFIVWRMA